MKTIEYRGWQIEVANGVVLVQKGGAFLEAASEAEAREMIDCALGEAA